MGFSFGTAIAAIWTPKRIVLAVDSKQASEDESEAATPVDKIKCTEDIFFALAGLAGCDEASFDAVEIIERSLQSQSSFKKKVQNAVAAVEGPLTAAVRYLKDNKPDDFKKYLAGKDALDIIFCGKSNGDMALSQVAFKIKRRGKDIILELRQRDYPNPKTNITSVELITGGIGQSVESTFLKQTNQQEALVYPEKSLKKFMDLAIAAEPLHIGYPVNIVSLGESGTTYAKIENT